MFACGSPLQPCGSDPHFAGSLLLRIGEELGKLSANQRQRVTKESLLGLLLYISHFGTGVLIGAISLVLTCKCWWCDFQ